MLLVLCLVYKYTLTLCRVVELKFTNKINTTYLDMCSKECGSIVQCRVCAIHLMQVLVWVFYLLTEFST